MVYKKNNIISLGAPEFPSFRNMIYIDLVGFPHVLGVLCNRWQEDLPQNSWDLIGIHEINPMYIFKFYEIHGI